MSKRDNYKDKLFESNCPIAKRDPQVAFARIDDIDGLMEIEYTARRFKRDIVWVRDSRASCIRSIDGEQVGDPNLYSDWYGLFTSIDDPMKTAQESIARYGITPTHVRDVVVKIEISDTPALEVPEGFFDPREMLGRRFKPYFIIPRDWYLDDEKVEARLAIHHQKERPDDYWARFFESAPNRLEPVTTDLIVFSSRYTEEENAAALAQLDAYRVSE